MARTVMAAALLAIMLGVASAQDQISETVTEGPGVARRTGSALVVGGDSADVGGSPPNVTNKIDMSVKALTAMGLQSALNTSQATWLVPTDQAWMEFVKEQNFNDTEELLKPEYMSLASSIAQYHLIPNVTLFSTYFLIGQLVQVPTLLGPTNTLTFLRGENGTVTVTDARNRTATLVEMDKPYNQSVSHVIDKVLLPL